MFNLLLKMVTFRRRLFKMQTLFVRNVTLNKIMYVLLFVTVVCLLYLKTVNVNRIESYVIDEEVFSSTGGHSVRMFNFSRALEPAFLYDAIRCRKSSHYYVRTLLCLHEIRNDVHVSTAIWSNF